MQIKHFTKQNQGTHLTDLKKKKKKKAHFFTMHEKYALTPFLHRIPCKLEVLLGKKCF